MTTITPEPQQLAQPSQGTNGFAVASFVLSILWLYGLGSLLAVVFGVIAQRQTGRSGQSGGNLAIAGLVLGILGLVGAVVLILVHAHLNACTN